MTRVHSLKHNPSPAGIHSRVSVLRPSPALADDVMGYVVRRRCADAGGHAALSAGFPANVYATLTVVHSGSLRDPASARLTTGATFSGAMTREASREYIDLPETTVVLFKPGRLTDVCRLPADELTDRWVDAGTILSPRERMEVAERMPEQRSVARQVHVLEAMLERRLQRAAHSRALPLARMVQQLFWQLPSMRASDLAEHTGLGGRQLHRRCVDTFGVPPKLLIRLARLQLSLWHVQASAKRGLPTLASVAQRSGFADHAHMAKDFRALLGRSLTVLRQRMRLSLPSEWAYELPQDLLHPRSAGPAGAGHWGRVSEAWINRTASGPGRSHPRPDLSAAALHESRRPWSARAFLSCSSRSIAGTVFALPGQDFHTKT